MIDRSIIQWLLAGDVSIQYQARRDLLGEAIAGLRSRIQEEGWGAMLLSRRNPAGHWGKGFYQPKWTSSHYTLLDLKNLGIAPNNGTPWDERMRPAIKALLKKRRKGGRWPLQAKHPGQVHFDMEKAGQPSRWNTLRALRVLKFYRESGHSA